MMAALAGRRIIVTRAAHQNGELMDALRAQGAVAVAVPLLEIESLGTTGGAAEVARWLNGSGPEGSRSLVVFTSANAVQAVGDVLAQLGGAVVFAAVGDKTRAVLAAHGRVAQIVAQTDGGALAVAVVGAETPWQRIWWPHGDLADGALATDLAQSGAEVRDAVVYRNVLPPGAGAEWAAAIAAGCDAVLFASASAVRNCPAPAAIPKAAVVVCIGPRTAAAARELGLAVHATAIDPSVPGMVAALSTALAGDAVTSPGE